MASTGAHAAGARNGPARGYARTPAQWYCLLAGLALLLAGVLGFVVSTSFDTGSAVQGDELILFDVNGWHNVVHVLSGLVLLAASPKPTSARAVAIAFGVVYGIVTLIGLIDGADVLGLIPVNGADNGLHVALSVLGLASGFMSPATEKARA